MSTPARWRPEPIVERIETAPDRVRVYEVAPRDGLQAEAAIVPTRTKIELVQRIAAAGLRDIEVTSFVPASWIPQMTDAADVLAGLGGLDGVRTVSLVPNARGLERALAAGAGHIAVLVSATESFARANLNAGREAALATATAVASAARGHGLGVRGYVSMAFGDPWEGPVDRGVVADMAASLFEAGCTTVALGDTIGVTTPGHIHKTVRAVAARGVAEDAVALHLHDTYGQALANVVAGLDAGVREFDSSVGALGRCPYARGATGNLATEDLVWLLHGIGIATGVDLDALVGVSRWIGARTGRADLRSRVATALVAAEAAGH
ncbi:hydroxymethylglutaryl-CoA lyase [Thermocatellispora tengchongensis]|uniref:Hydroxymethylglutaryl-CoA lyase n=1 Tax=Thermocatellispora tengchongensis TaxID=1073253 RepID=A0A840PII3_9ACTN|nr:hydroxymethylglutaryl-CoA lyase [Thermocatellispora tengchongensis]MBB5136917.1 hydroxymethylglutaryl-CoA lyase [Thermocatellispora tengchongensis]